LFGAGALSIRRDGVYPTVFRRKRVRTEAPAGSLMQANARYAPRTASRRTMHSLHFAEAEIAGWAHAKVNMAGATQGPLRNAQRDADVGSTKIFVVVVFKQGFEPTHDRAISTHGRRGCGDRASGQAFYQGLDHLLVKPMRGFLAYELGVPGLNGPYARRMQTPKKPVGRSPGQPSLYTDR